MENTTNVLLDTNILLRTQFDKSHQLTSATRAMVALRTQGNSLNIASQSFAEFWNVSTRPLAVNGYGLSVGETDRRLRFFESSFTQLYESETSYAIWRKLLLKYKVQGVQVHDTRLIVVMLANQIGRLLTYNTRDFERFSEIELIHPDRYVANL